MPTWKYLYTCSKTGVKIYKLGECTKKVYPDGRIEIKNGGKWNGCYWKTDAWWCDIPDELLEHEITSWEISEGKIGFNIN